MDLFKESDAEELLATLAEIFAFEGKAKEVAILAYAKSSIYQVDHDNWDGGIDGFNVDLGVPVNVFYQLGDERENVEKSIDEKANFLFRDDPSQYIKGVFIKPKTSQDKNWKEKSIAWLEGKDITNQGRVRSDNLAPLQFEGLLFRSPPEMFLFKALKAKGIPVAPLPVFVRGGREYQRLEPDFIIIKDGMTLVVEVDGDTIHHENPAEAAKRLAVLTDEGVMVERFQANECKTPDLAENCANRIIQRLAKIKANK